MLHTRKAQTETAQTAMAERNARRLEIVKRAMGVKYAHHPANHVTRDVSLPATQLVVISDRKAAMKIMDAGLGRISIAFTG